MTGRSGSTGAMPESNPSADPPESVPGYRDLARIGHGGFSVVYRAVQESFERDVALKILNIGPDEDARRRFLREVRLTSRLSGHPHVVTALDTGMTASGRPYLAMDLYDGGSMKERLKRYGPLSPVETAMVGAKIAEALAAAHSLGVLHRDVTPNNILVSRFGEPALADFGVSCLLDGSSSNSVLDAFSPQHAAPELMTRGIPTTSSDIYALGSTMHQLLTGRPPFGGEGRDVRSIMWRAVSEPPPWPKCPELPELADAILRAMAKEPDERFPDAAEFARTLRAMIPEGAPTALPGLPEATPLAAAAVAGGAPETVLDLDLDPHTSSAGRLHSSDHTMLRPDRADPASATSGGRRRRGAEGGSEKNSGGKGGRARRARTPVLIVLVLGLLGTAAWALLSSQGSAPRSNSASTSPHSLVTAAAYVSPTPSAKRPTPSTTPKVRHTSTAPVAPTEATTSAGALPSPSSSPSSNLLGSLLPGSYQLLQNAQSGSCLAEPAGSSAPTQQSCAPGKTEGWQYSLPLTGILAVGDVELVNEQSGLCITDSGGAISAQTCDGGSAQLWARVSGPGSSKEFQNAGDGQCLRAAAAVVSNGPCGTSDRADLWNEDGTA